MKTVRIILVVAVALLLCSLSAYCEKESGSTGREAPDRAKAREETAGGETLGERFHRETSITPGGSIADRGVERPKRPAAFKSYAGARVVELPEPGYRGLSVEEALGKRHSVRSYNDEPISMAQLSQLLFSAQGITGSGGGYARRASPSAGALYPFEVYVVATRVKTLPPGIYHYVVREHALELVKEGGFRKEIMEAGLSQSSLGDAAAVIVLTAIFDRTRSKYGERGFRYVYMEAGHIAQNLCLEAVSLGLGSVTVGAFTDEEVNRVIGVDGVSEAAIYLLPVGGV